MLAVTRTMASVPYTLSVGILAGGRANLMAMENGRRMRRRKKAVGNIDDMLIMQLTRSDSRGPSSSVSVSGAKVHRTPK